MLRTVVLAMKTLSPSNPMRPNGRNYCRSAFTTSRGPITAQEEVAPFLVMSALPTTRPQFRRSVPSSCCLSASSYTSLVEKRTFREQAGEPFADDLPSDHINVSMWILRRGNCPRSLARFLTSSSGDDYSRGRGSTGSSGLGRLRSSFTVPRWARKYSPYLGQLRSEVYRQVSCLRHYTSRIRQIRTGKVT